METGPSLLPEPSSYALTAIRSGTIFGLLFAILFSLVSASQKELFGGILLIGLFTGLFGGLSFGLIWASFFKGETATVEVGDKKVFVSRLNIAMYQLGYNPATQTDDFFSYK